MVVQAFEQRESRAPRLIGGGVFGLEESADLMAQPLELLRDRHVLMVNARSCIRLVVDRLSPRTVWMPSFLCSSMVEAMDGARTEICYYPIDGNLRVSDFTWQDSVKAQDLVILVDYFGFPIQSELAKRIRDRQAWILEDACQALLSRHVGALADFVVASPRKFIGVPDGGILAIQGDFELDPPVLGSPPVDWWKAALTACRQRREYDRGGDSRKWHSTFQESERNQPVGSFRMSEITETVLNCGLDWERIRLRRRSNFIALLDGLHDLALFKILPDDVTPLGFPIRVERRDDLRSSLFKSDIFPPIHWPVPSAIAETFPESHRLASTIMTLPCDQRYDQEDMERIITCVRDYQTA